MIDKVARAYNKTIKLKSFQVGDLVQKTILPHLDQRTTSLAEQGKVEEEDYRKVPVVLFYSF